MQHVARLVISASILVLAGSFLRADEPSAAVDLDGLRRFYLADIHMLRNYRPGKNSFVEGPDRRWGSYRAPGQRLTLLDVQGKGCLCHLWSTWRKGQGNYRLELYLDGASQPQIVGTVDELIAAARGMPDAPMPVVGFLGNRDARNLFLPIPFERGLRIEMETIEPTWLIFWQIDYRLGGDSGPPGRLLASVVDGHPTFRWERPASTPEPSPERPMTTLRRTVTIPASQRQAVVEWTGPAIVRRWSLHTDVPPTEQDRLDLEISYDDAQRPAVCAPLSDFFGPFRGVALWSDPADGWRTCYFPIPFQKRAVLSIRNRMARPVTVELASDVASGISWNPNCGYFHALKQETSPTTGYRQHEVLYVRGRGHWLGMALYNTGHDHGGGDFAVIDAEGENPAFLHGINGEDYFTFAWFGRGEHHPYAIAGSNEQGRCRLHFENPYPFARSLSIYWGTYPGLATRSVAYWYQDSADDTTVAPADPSHTATWGCFGPVPLVLNAEHRPVGNPFGVLPSVADLDAGKQFECRCVGERFTSGWMRQESIGPMLDLTYVSRHGTKIKGEVELGGMGHAWLARRQVTSPQARTAEFQLSYDDPIRVLVNGREVFRGSSHQGFVTERFSVALQAGQNEVVVQLTSFFNVNFNWAGFALQIR